jgi:DNA-binding response OmpR family regulator
MKILVVEDNPSTREIVRDIIEDTDYELTICSRGDTGEEEIRKEEWDLFIFDIMLPGKDGFQLLKIAKKIHRFTPVILFTALKDRIS